MWLDRKYSLLMQGFRHHFKQTYCLLSVFSLPSLWNEKYTLVNSEAIGTFPYWLLTVGDLKKCCRNRSFKVVYSLCILLGFLL